MYTHIKIRCLHTCYCVLLFQVFPLCHIHILVCWNDRRLTQSLLYSLVFPQLVFNDTQWTSRAGVWPRLECLYLILEYLGFTAGSSNSSFLMCTVGGNNDSSCWVLPPCEKPALNPQCPPSGGLCPSHYRSLGSQPVDGHSVPKIIKNGIKK